MTVTGHDGQGQMTHFVNDDGLNTFRLPVGWQFLTQDAETGTLNMTNFAEYNDLVNVSYFTVSCSNLVLNPSPGLPWHRRFLHR